MKFAHASEVHDRLVSRGRRKRIGLFVTLAMVVGSMVVGPFAGPAGAQQQPTLPSFMILLDVSGSMDEPSAADPNRSKLAVAQQSLSAAVGGIAPASINLGLRTFSGCTDADTALLIPVAPADPPRVVQAVNGTVPNGDTNITRALHRAAADLQVPGPKTIVLVSDGEDTCRSGDPCVAIAQIIAGGVQVRVDTIGFQTQGTPAESQLQCIADASGGTATSVNDQIALSQAIDDTIVTQPTQAAPVAAAVPAVPAVVVPVSADTPTIPGTLSFGFGEDQAIVASAAVVAAKDAPKDLAYTGANTRTLAQVGLWFVLIGCLALTCPWPRRRRL